MSNLIWLVYYRNFDEGNFEQHLSRPEDITLQEDKFHMDFGMDKIQLEGFGEESEDHMLVFDSFSSGNNNDNTIEVEMARAGGDDPSYEPLQGLERSGVGVNASADDTTLKENTSVTMEEDKIADGEKGGLGGDDFGMGDETFGGDGFGDEGGFGEMENPFENDASLNIEVNDSVNEQVVPETEDTFTLEPLAEKVTPAVATSQNARSNRRKRKIVVDQLIELDRDEMKKQLKDTNDIVGDEAKLAPASKRLMQQKDLLARGVEYLFTKPSDMWLSEEYTECFSRHLVNGRPDYPVGEPVFLEARDNEYMKAGDEREEKETEADTEIEPELEPLQEEEVPLDDGFNDTNPFEDQGDFGNVDDSFNPADDTFGAIEDGNMQSDEETGDRQLVNEEDFMFSQTADQMQDFRTEHNDTNDKGYSKRTYKMFKNLRTAFEGGKSVSYSNITEGKDRRTASACLFELLVLKTREFIEIEQSEPYGDIEATPENKFYSDPLVAA